MMGSFNDLTGKVFGKLTVIERAKNTKNYKVKWRCLCECGCEAIVRGDSLTSGRTKSCGCSIGAHPIHNDTGSKLYYTWQAMRYRCENPNHQSYKDYGGRGIKVCSEWQDYLIFKEWAYKNGYDDKLTIDRIDVNGDYTPDNCRWVTMKKQANNRRSNTQYEYNNESHSLSEWCDIYHLSYKTVHARIKDRGWSFEKAISTPIRTSA